MSVLERFRVTHDFRASSSPYLYEIAVTITNISTSAAYRIYRRVMDWDVEPTPFNEYVTIGVTGPLPASLLFASDDGFANPDPLSPLTSLGAVGLFTDVGPYDHGALFQFVFPGLAPGETKTFYLYYGAAPDEASALNALDDVGAQVYSLGQPSGSGGPDLGVPNTFIFGHRDPAAAGPESLLGPEGGTEQGEWPQVEAVPGVSRQSTAP